MELQDKGYDQEGRYTSAWTCVHLEVSSETVTTDEGMLTRFTSDAIVPSTDDSFKVYSLMEDVQKIVSDFPDHTFSGYLYVEGEENDDMWRLYVKDGKAIQVKPEIVWPEV
jgi:hypothetical protein